MWLIHGRERDLLVDILSERWKEQILVFGKTKHGCNRLAEQLENAANFYGRFVDRVVTARGTREAETVKAAEAASLAAERVDGMRRKE